MSLPTETYLSQQQRLPDSGKSIIACYDAEHIVVYQAYKPSIAEFAVKHQKLGGNDYKETRMTWIKPGFLWMMYRSGWAGKTDQERVLAITLRQIDFEEILSHAVPTSFKPNLYTTEADWKEALKNSYVQIQWDPDHDPFGKKQSRRAIQIGLTRDMARRYANECITAIEDITDFVHTQKQVLDTQGIAALIVPYEEVYLSKHMDLSQI